MRHKQVVLDFFGDCRIQIFDGVSKEIFISLKEESDLIFDLGDIDIEGSLIHSIIPLAYFVLIDNGCSGRVNIHANKTSKFVLFDLFPPFGLASLAAGTFTHRALNNCGFYSTSIALSQVFLLFLFG